MNDTQTHRTMKTRKVSTRFMQGNKDVEGVIFDILVDENGMGAVCSSDFDPDEAIYSDGFISAVKDGKIPTLKLHPTDSHRFYNELTEYHHVIINDQCYNVYFKS